MTNSVSAERPAVVLPRVSTVPSYAWDEADDAAFLSSSYGLTPDGWQMVPLKGLLSRREDGKYAASRVGMSVPRQNGKNGIIEVRELFGMVALGEKFLHTAHEVKTARKAFLRLCSFFENPREYPELASMVKEIRRTNGQEAIVLHNGGAVEFVARTKGSGRGFTVDVLVFDEAQELSDETLAALLPTISAAPLGNPQQIYAGTPPSGNMAGEVFTRIRNAGLEGSDPRLAWYEWSAERGSDFDDYAVWREANPALGIRLDEETILGERTALDDASFGRERLGMWEEEVSFSVISAEEWGRCADEMSEPHTDIVLAIDVSPDRTQTSVAVAGEREDGLWHVEVIENRSGVGWVVPRVVEIARRQRIRTVVIDGASPANSLIEGLRKHRVNVVTTSGREMAAACGEFFDAVMEQRLAHLDDPRTNAALSRARKRRLGDAWAWNRADSGSDITPIVSITLALWGAQSTRVRRKKRTGSSSNGPRRAVVWQ